MPHPAPNSASPIVTQITSDGCSLQAKNGAATVENLFPERTGVDPASRTGRMPPGSSPQAAYLHIPFCFHRCHYCDFYSIVDSQDRQQAFTERLAREIDAAGPFVTEPLEAVFVGGGTPTLLSADLWARLIPVMNRRLPLRPDGEFTIEANPETIEEPLLEVLVAGGVNRISVGGQSFDVRHLKTLERWHDPANVVRAIELIRAAGIDNINVDLIFGIPGQSVDDWRRDLLAALDLGPEHLSCYGLTYEPNTAMTARLRRGEFERVEEDVEAEMYEVTVETLAAAGFEQYEISNWARPGRECRHNLIYWRNGHWWPLGPSAAGHIAGRRWRNVPRITDYLESGPLPPITDVECLDADGRAGEELMLRLRLVEGIEETRFDRLTGDSPRGAARREAVLRHIAGGLLVREGGRLRLTGRGRLLADGVLCDLI